MTKEKRTPIIHVAHTQVSWVPAFGGILSMKGIHCTRLSRILNNQGTVGNGPHRHAHLYAPKFMRLEFISWKLPEISIELGPRWDDLSPSLRSGGAMNEKLTRGLNQSCLVKTVQYPYKNWEEGLGVTVDKFWK